MNKLTHITPLAAVLAVLLAAAAFFRFAMHGYSYIAHTLVFVAVVIVLHRVLPASLWRAAAALIAVGLIYFSVLEVLILSASRTSSDAHEKQYVIVLGAQVKGTRPSPSLYYRLAGALDILTLNPNAVAIVTGGQGEGEDVTEAECMRSWLIEVGIDPARIICEDKATSTMENLEFSFDLIRERGDEPDGNVTILSSSYHLYRAKAMAARLSVDAAGYAAAPGNPLLALNFFIREAFGVTHLWVFGE